MGMMFCNPKKPPTGDTASWCLQSMGSPVILFLGKSRTGKNTMMRCMYARYKLRRVNVIQIIKKHIIDGTVMGHILEDITYVDKSLLPRIIVLEMVKRYMCDYLYQSSGFILDGYPRNLQQAMEFEQYIAPISMIIYMRLEQPEAIHRLAYKLPSKASPEHKADATAWRNIMFELRTPMILHHFEGATITLDGKKKISVTYVDVMDCMDEVFAELNILTPSRFV